MSTYTFPFENRDGSKVSRGDYVFLGQYYRRKPANGSACARVIDVTETDITIYITSSFGEPGKLLGVLREHKDLINIISDHGIFVMEKGSI